MGYRSLIGTAASDGLVLGGAFGSAASAQDVIRALAPTWVGFAPALVAQNLCHYEEEGLTLDFRFEDHRTNVMAAIEHGDIDVDMRTVGEHQGRPRVAETPGTIIGTIDISVGSDGVLVEDTTASVADLKGRVVAIEPNISARLPLQMEMREAGLSPDDVELREIATADTIAVFADTTVAAERWLEGVLDRGGVWFAPLEEIAAHLTAECSAGAVVRVERPLYYDRPVHLG